MNTRKKIIASFLLMVLFSTILPTQLLHLFHNHGNDAEHIEIKCHTTHFEVKHQHCPSLNYVVHFYTFVEEVITHLSSTITASDFVFNYQFYKNTLHYFFAMKAPPETIA